MFKNITLFSLFLFTVAGLAQSNDCAEYKEGKFKITDPATKKACYITRKDSVQVERMEDSEDEYYFDIKWIDDCTYTITPTASAILRNKELEKSGTITVKITKTKDSSYIQRVTVANNPKFRRIDEVFVLPEDKK